MARTTSEPKTRTIKLRISEELLTEIGEGNVSDRVRELIKKGLEGNVPQKAEGQKDNVPQKEIPYLSDIEGMCQFLGIELEDFFKQIEEGLNEGRITYDGELEFHGEEDVDLSRFKEACDEKGVSYQKAVDKMTQMVWNG